MPFEIEYGHLIPMGFAAESKPFGSAKASVNLLGFHSSEDGNELIKCLDGLSRVILDRLPPDRRPAESQIDHLVVTITKSGKATVYINELSLVGTVRTKKGQVNLGDSLAKDDIADICDASFDGIELPDDAAIIVLISIGWRQAVYYDFWPIAPYRPLKRIENPKLLLARIVSYLLFQERFTITREQWAELFRQGWFPFIGLSTDQLRAILVHAETKVSIDPLLDSMKDSANSLSAAVRGLVATHEALSAHRLTLTKALEHFESGDYLSCTTMLFPRIEGVLRDWRAKVHPGRATQRHLAATANIDPQVQRHEYSLLLPHKFQEFLETVYFATFDPLHPQDVSRNTVSHGVAPEDKMGFKSALLSVLIIDQIIRMMPVVNVTGPRAAE